MIFLDFFKSFNKKLTYIVSALGAREAGAGDDDEAGGAQQARRDRQAEQGEDDRRWRHGPRIGLNFVTNRHNQGIYIMKSGFIS